jgi:hypothetical protein
LCGGQNSVAEESEADILAWILHEAQKSQSSTRTDIANYGVKKPGKSITRAWVDSLLIRPNVVMTKTVSNSPDDPRLQVPREFLIVTICEMEEAPQSSVRELASNLNELGVSEWDDRETRTVVVPAEMGSQAIHHGANRNLKHMTIGTCLAASEKHTIPFVMTSQDSGNLRRGLGKNGIEFGRHYILKESQKWR